MVSASHTPRVCISILNWNSVQDTQNCLDSLKNSVDESTEVVVLDNGSKDHSASVLSNIPSITFLRSSTNLGFSGGHNLVIKYALTKNDDYIWLLNNDAIPQGKCLEKLVAFAEANPISALISPVILDKAPPHDFQHIISVLNKTGTGAEEIKDIEHARRLLQESPDRIIIWGTALLVRLNAIEKIGLLDEKLFAYAEDTDYALRAISQGYRNSVVLDAFIHHEQNPHPRTAHFYYYTQRNSVVMTRKYVSTINFIKLVRWNLRLVKRHEERLKNRPELVRAAKLGVWHRWLNKGGEYNPNVRISLFGLALVNIALFFA